LIEIDIIPSKSYAHRALICAALSARPCRVICNLASDDIEATRACVAAMNAGSEIMECGESGSTLRFMLPVLAGRGQKGSFRTKGRLGQRPLSPLYEELSAHGCRLSPRGETPITIEGQLIPGDFTIPGNVSSQFITGLLLALPMLDGDSRIMVEGRLESSAYVDMTLEVMKQFGIRIDCRDNVFSVPGSQKYQGPAEYTVEGDWSAAAFWLAAGAIGRVPVRINGLNLASIQGDRGIVDIMKNFGADIRIEEGGMTAYPSKLNGTDVDVSGVPDLTPAIALAAAVAGGRTCITGAGRLRIKESDRLVSISSDLNRLGADVTELEEGLVIEGTGGKPLKGGSADSFGDHRIAMMAAVAALASKGKVAITGKDAVNKSYPGFFEEMAKWR
jgi:3-phosphoshikimate 1-carboxyvinyltransferase